MAATRTAGRRDVFQDRPKVLAPVLAAVMAAMLAAPVAAMNDGPIAPAPSPASCPRGQALDPQTKTCVKIQALSIGPSERFAMAFAFNRVGRYDDAVAVLDPIAHRRDPLVLTELGFAFRKLGRYDTAIGYYRAALTVDPAAARTRSYLGEGYVALGRLDLARAELAEIERLTGAGSAPYTVLAAAIAAAERRG
jgi:tetratricopeptide (TPR) repeat protein